MAGAGVAGCGVNLNSVLTIPHIMTEPTLEMLKCGQSLLFGPMFYEYDNCAFPALSM